MGLDWTVAVWTITGAKVGVFGQWNSWNLARTWSEEGYFAKILFAFHGLAGWNSFGNDAGLAE